jgi:hypothetical protein
MGTRNWVGIGLLYRPAIARICKPFKVPGIDSQPGGPVRQLYLLYRLAGLHRLVESIPWNRFLGSSNVYKYGIRLHWLAELVPWNRFPCSITWRTKTNFDPVSFFRFNLVYFWNKPSLLRLDFSNLWNTQSSLHFDLFIICGINRSRFASIFPICGINRVRSASIFRICGMNRNPLRFDLSKV